MLRLSIERTLAGAAAPASMEVFSDLVTEHDDGDERLGTNGLELVAGDRVILGLAAPREDGTVVLANGDAFFPMDAALSVGLQEARESSAVASVHALGVDTKDLTVDGIIDRLRAA